jgi:two-component system, chemotaxis family, response regulator Rcp1
MEKIMEIGTEGHRPMEVLLCEDSPGDVRLTREAFREANKTVNLHIVTDGVEAIAYLKSEHDSHVSCPRPDLILLDLNMPRMGGREVLAYLKTHERLKTIPVLILTTSVSEADITNCYQLAANCYLNKPVELEEFERLVKSINDFWLTMAKLPRHDPLGADWEQVPQQLNRDPAPGVVLAAQL